MIAKMRIIALAFYKTLPLTCQNMPYT